MRGLPVVSRPASRPAAPPVALLRRSPSARFGGLLARGGEASAPLPRGPGAKNSAVAAAPERGVGGEPPSQTREDARSEGEQDDRDPAAKPSANATDAPEVRGLDPLERALWEPTHPRLEGPSPLRAPAPAQTLAPPLEALVDRFLKRFAMSGDRNKGTAHLSVGAGELAGGTVTVHAESGGVTIVVDAPPGVDAAAFGARLADRLLARGVVATIEVR